MRAAQQVIRAGSEPAAVFAAAVAPSARVYWVAASARPLLEAYAA